MPRGRLALHCRPQVQPLIRELEVLYAAGCSQKLNKIMTNGSKTNKKRMTLRWEGCRKSRLWAGTNPGAVLDQ